MIPSGIRSVGLWLKNNVRPDESIIIGADPSDVWQNTILLQSGISPTRCLSVYIPLIGRGTFESREEFESYLLAHRTRYLVLNSDGSLQEILGFELGQKTQRLGNGSFEAVFEQDVSGFGKYVIYGISYSEASASLSRNGPK